MRLALVYQYGIANVFDVTRMGDMPELPAFGKAGYGGDRRERLLQGTHTACEWYCRGAEHAGAVVLVFHCDVAGDCAARVWNEGAGDIFEDSKHFKAKR